MITLGKSTPPTQEEIEEVYLELLKAKESIGDIFSFERFLELVKQQCFIDYDGYGEFIDNTTGEHVKDLICDVKWLKKNKPKNSDYIRWYNK